MPFNNSNPVLYYNKKSFTAAGLDPNKPPTSLDRAPGGGREDQERERGLEGAARLQDRPGLLRPDARGRRLGPRQQQQRAQGARDQDGLRRRDRPPDLHRARPDGEVRPRGRYDRPGIGRVRRSRGHRKRAVRDDDRHQRVARHHQPGVRDRRVPQRRARRGPDGRSVSEEGRGPGPGRRAATSSTSRSPRSRPRRGSS